MPAGSHRDLIILDVDGVLVPVLDVDPATVVMADADRRRILDAIRHGPDAHAVLTGRSLLSEIERILAFEASIVRDLPIMTAHGYALHLGGSSRWMDLPDDERTVMERTRLFEVAFRRLLATLDPEHPAGAIAARLRLTVQRDRLNVNVSQVPSLLRPRAVRTVEALLRHLRDARTDPMDVATSLIRHLSADRVVRHHSGDAAPASPMRTRIDPDGTFVELHGVGTKGDGLLHWMRLGLLPAFDRHLVIVADNLQPGGSDRPLAEVAVSAFGGRVRLWQSLDGLDKAALGEDDPLRPHLDHVARDPAGISDLLASHALGRP